MFNVPAATGTRGSDFVGHSRFLDLFGYLVLGCAVCTLEGYVHVKLAFLCFLFFKTRLFAEQREAGVLHQNQCFSKKF